MKLGLLTAPFPDTPLMEVADWTAANGFDSPRDRLLAADPPARAGATPARPTSTWPTLTAGPGVARSWTRSRAKGLSISGLGYYPNPLHPDPAHREMVIGHLKHGSWTPPSVMGVGLVNTFMGGDGARRRRTRTGRRRSASGRTSFATPRTTGVKITIENCPMLFSLRRVAGRPQHRHQPPDVAPDPGDVGRHDRAQLRPVAPRPPDDRHPPVHPRVRAARPPRTRPRT